MVGSVLEDRYELEELVGRGGMSSVYRARDRILGREVAIKMLHDQYVNDKDQVERFRREARAVAKLAQSNVAVVIDRGEDEGRPYIVFEYVEGGSLKRLIQEDAPLPLDRVLELGVQIARGLEHAHRSGLVHRDVKPQNVLLDGGGVAKVIDFGIARSSNEVRPGLTLTGTVLGSSDYISPEQAQGRTVEERTDVYSLAIVLYELLTGELPFTGENFVAVAMRHINEEPPSVLDRRRDVPPRLAQLMDRALAKDPERRPMMSTVVQELEQCQLELPVEEETVILPVVRPRDAPGVLSNWQLITVLAGLAIGAALCIYLLVRGTNKPSSPATAASSIVHLHAPTAYDPYGTGGENDSAAPLATDGKLGTYWQTETYNDAPSLDKKGVGLVLDAGKSVPLHRISIVTSTPGFTAEIMAGPTRTSFPNVVADLKVVGRNAHFDLISGSHRYYLLWITKLGPHFKYARINQVTGSD
jgi:eukaryotic-like serine/threonine-protein kinase